jgi:hypothetical protein
MAFGQADRVKKGGTPQLILAWPSGSTPANQFDSYHIVGYIMAVTLFATSFI